MDATWRIELSGQIAVTIGERRVERFRTRRAALLLARLALSNSLLRRDDLVDWLWPDSDFEVGRNRLSVALSALRRELAPSTSQAKLFTGNHDFVGLNWNAAQTDVAEFDARLKRANGEKNTTNRAQWLEEALTAWNGTLWNGDDNEWLVTEAHRWNELFYEAAISLGELEAKRGLDSLRRAVKMAPAREDVARALMRALMETGREDEARQTWRELENVLRTEWNRTPTATTRTLGRQLFDVTAPPVVPYSRSSKNLPPRSNRFFGREIELETLSGWLAKGSDARIITISGGGGYGKTRLALEAARRLESSFNSEICFVELAGQNDAQRVLDIIGDAMRAPRLSTVSDLERLARAIGSRRLLLVLDNFEHLVSAAPDIKRLLAQTPNLVCLCTSRRLLEIPGERAFTLSPLPVPPPKASNMLSKVELDKTLLGDWTRNSAIRLFVDRARISSPSFRLHTGNAGDVAQLCRALEGVPLALELAAARTLALSPAQIGEHLKSRLDVLEAHESSGKDARHSSLRAALDWSYELLAPDEQRIFRRLSVFRGSWTLERASAVCAQSSREKGEFMLKVHEELRRHSLLEAQDEDSELRFRFTEAVRRYAQERLAKQDKPQARKSLQLSHALTFAQLANRAARLGSVEFPRAGTYVVEREIVDLQAAFEWSLEHNSILALQIAVSLWWFWFSTSRLDEGRQALKRALDASRDIPDNSPLLWDRETVQDEPINWRIEAQSGGGFLAWRQGDLMEAISLCSQALAKSRESGGGRAQVYSLLVLQLAETVRGNFAAARALGEECLGLARTRHDQFIEAFALHLLGAQTEMEGDARTAWSLQEQSLALFHLLGSDEGEGWVLFNWGSAARRLGDYRRAVELCVQGRARFESILAREGIAYCDLYAAFAWRDAGDNQNAWPLLHSSLKELYELNARWGVSMALEGVATVAFDGSPQSGAIATRLWSAAQFVREQLGTPVPPVDRDPFQEFEHQLKTSLPAPSFEAAWQTGRTLSFEQIVQIALDAKK